jgi:hypothetical protein
VGERRPAWTRTGFARGGLVPWGVRGKTGPPCSRGSARSWRHSSPITVRAQGPSRAAIPLPTPPSGRFALPLRRPPLSLPGTGQRQAGRRSRYLMNANAARRAARTRRERKTGRPDASRAAPRRGPGRPNAGPVRERPWPRPLRAYTRARARGPDAGGVCRGALRLNPCNARSCALPAAAQFHRSRSLGCLVRDIRRVFGVSQGGFSAIPAKGSEGR